MRQETRRIWLLSLLPLGLLLASAAPASAATTIGSNLNDAAGTEGICGFGTFHEDRPCLTAQESLLVSRLAPGGLTSPLDGVIVRWSVRSAVAEPGTQSATVRLRVLRGGTIVAGGSDAFVPFPLREPGIHSFPVRLPIRAGDRIAIDSVVTNTGTQSASLPILHIESGVGSYADQAAAPMPDGTVPTLSPHLDGELLLNAVVEVDADHDGYGDESQDSCPTNPASQAPCPIVTDSKAPKTKLTYSVRQNFLESHEVIVHLRSNEAARAFASGQLEIPGEHAIWGINSARAQVKAGKKVTLRLLVPPKARRATRRALRQGEKVRVKVVVSATDAAGNESGKTVATIKPMRKRH